MVLHDALKASDFIFRSLLPSFRGYLLTGADGRLRIRSRSPIITGTIQENLAPGATTIEVDDALAWRNLMLCIEELRIAQDHQVTLTARLYADKQSPQSATARTIVLTGGAGWLLNPPGAVTNLSLSIPNPGTLRGEFQFSGYLGSQVAKIEVMRAG